MSINGSEGKKRISVVGPDNDAPTSTGYRIPRVAILESADEIMVKAELPGVGPEDVDVKIDHHRLTLEARRRPIEAERLPAVVRGRDLDSYRRTFTIGRGIDTESMRAAMGNDGMLVVHLPKRKEESARNVEINMGY